MSETIGQAYVEQLPLANDIVLHEEDLNEQAKQEFSHHDEVLRALELNRRSLIANNYLTQAGQYLLLDELSGFHRIYKNTLNYAVANKEKLANSALGSPLIICGLPRTGSTLLYNLLACDPNCRAPLITDMFLECVPPIARSNSVEQQQRALKLLQRFKLVEQLTGRPYLVAASHPVLPIEEDYIILLHVGISFFALMHCLEPKSEFEIWFLKETDKEYIYEYHELFLRMLNSVDSPQSHWLLKAPLHCLFLDNLVKQYPSAFVIMTHRSLEDVIPSLYRLFMAYSSVYINETYQAKVDNVVRRAIIQMVDTMTERIVKFRTQSHPNHLRNQSQKTIFDVGYDALMEQPIATVRCIYDHFGLHYSNEFEEKMQVWLGENPQGKQGRHTYHLSDMRLTQEDIAKRYSHYIELFQRNLSPKTISNADHCANSAE